LAMREILDEATDPDDQRLTGIHFSIGKAYDDFGDHTTAFSHYAAGAKLQRGRLDFDEARNASFFEEIKNTFNAAFFANAPAGKPSELPIFIVGMPRSGSTLIEQILASHFAVFGPGEIKTLTRCV